MKVTIIHLFVATVTLSVTARQVEERKVMVFL